MNFLIHNRIKTRLMATFNLLSISKQVHKNIFVMEFSIAILSQNIIFTVCNSSWRKVMFSQASVILSKGRTCMGGAACMAGRVYVAGDMCMLGCAW